MSILLANPFSFPPQSSTRTSALPHPPSIAKAVSLHKLVAMAAQHTTVGGNSAFHNFNNDFAHISDANERRRLALAEIDRAPFGWYHVRACVVAGIGFFTDSYDVSIYTHDT